MTLFSLGWFAWVSVALAVPLEAAPQCSVRGGDGVFSYQKILREGPAHCGATVVASQSEGPHCWMGFVTSAHCLVKAGPKGLEWKIHRGDRLRSRLGPLRVQAMSVNQDYLSRLQTRGNGFHPMTDLALVIARGNFCPKPVPVLTTKICKSQSNKVPFLLACPGEGEAVSLEPIYASGDYSNRVLSSLGLETGSSAPWRGYSQSRKGCSGGPWLKFHQNSNCSYDLEGICAVHAGHGKTGGTLRESRGSPVSPQSNQWKPWCQTLRRWGLSCPITRTGAD